MANKIQSSLTVKLLWVITAISLFLVLITSAVEIVQDRNNLIETEKRESRAAVSANSAALSLALWSLDQRALDITTRSLISGTSIYRAEILEGGKALLTVHRDGVPRSADHVWEVPLHRPNSDQVIGVLRVSENFQPVMDSPGCIRRPIGACADE